MTREVKQAAKRLTGINLRDALRLFESLGGAVERKRRTGELRVRHPRLPKPVVVNCRRKDSPRALTVALRKLAVG
jgi:hypothetical protein